MSLTTQSAFAEDDVFLDLIPDIVVDSVQNEESVENTDAQKARYELFWETALTAGRYNDAFGTISANNFFKVRSSWDARGSWQPRETLLFTVSNRTNFVGQYDVLGERDGLDFRNDLRELSVQWKVSEKDYLEAGRINLRNGSAIGFNPTDYFRSGTLIDQSSLNPSERRDNRLGVVLVNYQTIWSGGAANIAFAPKIADRDFADQTDAKLAPKLRQTNNTHRLLSHISYTREDISFDGYFLLKDGEPELGVSSSFLLSDAVVGYAEWSIADRVKAINEATACFSVRDFETIANQGACDNRPMSYATVGGTYSNAAIDSTITLEYQFNEAGLNRSDFATLFDLQRRGVKSSFGTNVLDFANALATERQVPLSRHSLFGLWDVADPFAFGLDVSGLAVFSPNDQSVLFQLGIEYEPVDPAWVANLYLTTTSGSDDTVYGSASIGASATFQIRRYF